MDIKKRDSLHILIVDDEKSICDILGQYLQKIGYRATLTRTGEDALQVLAKDSVDMVLSDIKMPGMSGVDLLKQIKEQNRAIPVLLTTGFPTLDTAIEALKLGAYDYLTKPFHLEEIGEKIRRAMANKRLEQENLLLSNLVSLHEVTKELNATHELNDLQHKVLDYSARLSKSDGGCLMFFDGKANPILFESVGDDFNQTFWSHEAFLKIGQEVFEKGEPLIVSAKAQQLNSTPMPPGSPIESYIAFPLKTPTKTLGILNLVRKQGQQEFSNLDLEILNVLASQASISIENVKLYQNIRDNYLKTIRGFALAVEAKDRYTHGHSENVMKYTTVLARRMGLPDHEIEQVKSAGLLHDIGKIGISDTILNKPGKLTIEEFEEIKKHPELGARIIADVPFLKSLVPLVLHHHEFYDGSGYPEGIRGEQIPFGARILGVCDSYEAMTSDRPYRKAMSNEVAIKILNENKNRQFDPAIVDAFVEMMKGKT
jgi:response regulator RpfG family c-di-GMP phosphodiesterase